jgi:predicted RNA-binding protein with PIN domain
MVDGYNVICTWDSLKRARGISMEYAREMLVNMLVSYADSTGVRTTVIFDGVTEEYTAPHGDVEVIFSGKKKSADSVIERLVYKEKDRECAVVVTSDAHVRNMVYGMGAFCVSAKEFENQVLRATREIGDGLDRFNMQQ